MCVVFAKRRQLYETLLRDLLTYTQLMKLDMPTERPMRTKRSRPPSPISPARFRKAARRSTQGHYLR
jgi:hypothetical protein